MSQDQDIPTDDPQPRGRSPIAAWRRWRSGHMGRLVAESFRSQGRLYGVAIVAMVFVAAASAGSAWIMEGIVDSLTNPDQRSMVFLVSGGVVGLFALKAVASYVQAVYLIRAGNRIVAMQQERVYRKLLKRGVAFFNDTESSDLLMRVTYGAQAARQLIDILVTSFVRDALTLVGLVGVMIYQQPFLSMMFLVVGPMAIFGVRLLLKSVRKIMEAEFKSMAEIIKVLQETSAGIQVIKVFGLETRMVGRMDTAIAQVEKRSNDIARLQSIASPLMEFLAGLAIAGVVIVSAFSISGDATPTAGQLMSFVTALLMAYEPAKRLSRMRVTIETNMVGVTMLFDLLDEEEPLQEAPDAVALPDGPGELRFNEVQFGYRPEALILKHIDLVFEAGKTTALVGRSGGGKSTLLSLVMRFYDPTQGSVTIDGLDLRHSTFESLRGAISYVGQDTFLFATSVLENMRCSAPDASDEQVIAAAKAAHAHDFIMALPQGYDTPVGENGTFLSGGQKQRLAIARAILRKPRVLLLDEATSALDSESETQVKQAFDELTRDVTTIVIAHRLSTVMNADKIVVVDDGWIFEQGSATELLSNPDGAFRNLYDQQFGGTEGITEKEAV